MNGFVSSFEINNRFVSHLSSEQVDEMYLKYTLGVKIKELIEYYQLAVTPNRFYSIFPPVECDNKKCRHCGSEMYYFRSRREFKADAKIKCNCNKCGHEELVGDVGQHKCMCKKCEGEARATANIREIEKKQQEAISREKLFIANSAKQSVAFESLSLRDVLSLAAFLSCQRNDWSGVSLSLNEVDVQEIYSPMENYSNKLLLSLFQNQVLVVDSHNSPLDAFTSDGITPRYPAKIYWKPNVHIGVGNEPSSLNELSLYLAEFFSGGGWLHHWSCDIPAIWMEIAIEECLQYLDALIRATKNLRLLSQERIRNVFHDLLQSFSVSQIFFFCFRSVKEAAAFLEDKSCSGYQHASNTIPVKLNSLPKMYLLDDQKFIPRNFNRDSKSPQSAISRIFFDQILRLEDDAGFKASPAKYWADNLKSIFPEDVGRMPDSFMPGKHYLRCLGCHSPDVSLRFHEADGILMSCPDCGEKHYFLKRS